MRLMVLMAALAVTGCAVGKDLGTTDQAVTAFHAQLDAGKFSAIEDSAGPEIKTTPGSLTAILAGVHDRLGAVKSTSRNAFGDNVNNGDHTVTVTYATIFEKGPGSEEFVFRMVGAAPQLIGYHIKSQALLGPAPVPGSGSVPTPVPTLNSGPQAPQAAEHSQ